jgi:hypothetical protein
MASKDSYIGIKNVVDKNPFNLTKRILVGTPTTGLLRVEWVGARFSQTIPTNWSSGDIWQFMSSYIPLAYQIADAENLICKAVVEGNYEWLLSIESDNVIPPDTFRKMNEYMMSKEFPVVGGLYFTKSSPPEPMIYRKAGTGYYNDWKFGDKVMCDGLPLGCTLIHGDLIREVWKDSAEYVVNGQVTRRVFEQPNEGWRDPVSGAFLSRSGTTDLAFFRRLIDGGYLAKAGFLEAQKQEFPFMVDTSIFVRHIDNNGVQWPIDIPSKFEPSPERVAELLKEFTGPFK